MQLNLMQQAVQQALKQTGLPPSPPNQRAVWQSVRDNPVALVSYVNQRTGLTGDDLLRETTAYHDAMKARYK